MHLVVDVNAIAAIAVVDSVAGVPVDSGVDVEIDVGIAIVR